MPEDFMKRAFALIDLVAVDMRALPNGFPGARETVKRLGEVRPNLAFVDKEKNRMPACRFLPDAMEQVRARRPDIAGAVDALEPDLYWHFTTGYDPSKFPSSNYLENYAYCQIIGREGPLAAADFRMGLFVVAPQEDYP